MAECPRTGSDQPSTAGKGAIDHDPGEDSSRLAPHNDHSTSFWRDRAAEAKLGEAFGVQGGAPPEQRQSAGSDPTSQQIERPGVRKQNSKASASRSSTGTGSTPTKEGPPIIQDGLGAVLAHSPEGVLAHGSSVWLRGVKGRTSDGIQLRSRVTIWVSERTCTTSFN